MTIGAATIFNFFFSLTLILVTLYVTIPKRLHLFEILFSWFIYLVVHGTFLAIIILNYKLIEVNTNLFLLWTYVVNRFFLMPLLVIWLLDLYVSVRAFLLKMILTGIVIAILTGIEYLADWLGVIYHAEPWQVWWAIVQWAALIVIVYLFNLWFRNVFEKEVRTR